eukprot:CAMPEP_0170454622 /NCGR_PEP_ID=MMETSP0123-20130129/2811_1 /TAXON_ID=182087 /ORGANISM="Favella ehrenbergii, Strain Fehren 1" /LENGTH=104 /DNA_ID=CAMNT_0010717393 /DNA_START=165 /DNA_END=479 /DNA_ORIENTATION=+
MEKGIFSTNNVTVEMGVDTVIEEPNINDDLVNFIGPIAQYKKNSERDFWQNEALNDLFAGERVFTKMENNSTSVRWINGRYSLEQSSIGGGKVADDEEEGGKKG